MSQPDESLTLFLSHQDEVRGFTPDGPRGPKPDDKYNKNKPGR